MAASRYFAIWSGLDFFQAGEFILAFAAPNTFYIFEKAYLMEIMATPAN